MNDYEDKLSYIIAVIILIISLAAPNFLYYKNKLNKIENIINKSGDVRKLSKIINIIWAVLFIPSIFISLYTVAGISMAAEAVIVWINTFQYISIIISILLFLAVPASIIISVILSFVYRKKENFMLSVLVQFTPIIIFSFAFIIIFVVFITLRRRI